MRILELRHDARRGIDGPTSDSYVTVLWTSFVCVSHVLFNSLVPCTVSDNMPSGYEYDLLSTDFNPPMPDLLDSQSPIQVMMSPYVFPTADPGAAAQSSAVWSSFLETLRLSQLEAALGYDPEGAAAVSKALDLESSLTPTELSPEKQAELTDHRQRAMYCLLKSGYNKEEARAVTSLWMMAGSLRQGHFECWGNCLDIILGWAHKRLSAISSRPGPFAISTLEDTERVVLGRGLWSDLIASITTRQIPLHIDLYRTVLPAADYDILDCPNNVALAFAEIVTLAANSSHIPQARGKLNALRKDLEHSSAKPTAQIHTAGVRLYLEIVASRGMADSAPVQKAVEALCKLILETDSLRRDFAFWIFLAGCHATDQGQWHGCRLMMNELIDAEEEKDVALKVASGKPCRLWRFRTDRCVFRHYGPDTRCPQTQRRCRAHSLDRPNAQAGRSTCLVCVRAARANPNYGGPVFASCSPFESWMLKLAQFYPHQQTTTPQPLLGSVEIYESPLLMLLLRRHHVYAMLPIFLVCGLAILHRPRVLSSCLPFCSFRSICQNVCTCTIPPQPFCIYKTPTNLPTTVLAQQKK